MMNAIPGSIIAVTLCAALLTLAASVILVIMRKNHLVGISLRAWMLLQVSTGGSALLWWIGVYFVADWIDVAKLYLIQRALFASTLLVAYILTAATCMVFVLYPKKGDQNQRP